MNEPLEQYAEFYDRELDAYGVDDYARAVGLDLPGTCNAAYESLARDTLVEMEAYNEERGRSTAEKVQAWLARFERGAVWAVIILWFVAFWTVGLVALLAQ